jgi:hypothetical protein
VFAQAEDERAECRAHLATLARCIDTSNLATTASVSLALRDALGRCVSTEALEAVAVVVLNTITAHGASLTPEERSEQLGFLHSQFIIILEDLKPLAALRFLLRGAAAAEGLGDPNLVGQFVECAFAVYDRYCALPPPSLVGFAMMMQCMADLRILEETRHREFVRRLQRYATSMPVREDRVRLSPLYLVYVRACNDLRF